MDIKSAKLEVLAGCRAMVDKGLTVGTAGNISMRADAEGVFVITPTSMDYSLLTPDDLVVVDYDGNIVSGKWQPSIEVSMHRLILLNRPDVQAVVHTHSLHATAFASSKEATFLPAFAIEVVSYLGGEIAIAEFAPPGSLELAEATVKALGTNAGVLMRNHGAIGVGKTMRDALTAAEILEKSCQIAFFSRLMGGLSDLPAEFVASAKQKFLEKRGVRR